MSDPLVIQAAHKRLSKHQIQPYKICNILMPYTCWCDGFIRSIIGLTLDIFFFLLAFSPHFEICTTHAKFLSNPFQFFFCHIWFLSFFCYFFYFWINKIANIFQFPPIIFQFINNLSNYKKRNLNLTNTIFKYIDKLSNYKYFLISSFTILKCIHIYQLQVFLNFTLAIV